MDEHIIPTVAVETEINEYVIETVVLYKQAVKCFRVGLVGRSDIKFRR